jgi:hypothetical protein
MTPKTPVAGIQLLPPAADRICPETYLFSPVADIADDWVGSKVPLTDHRIHACPSRPQEGAWATKGRPPVQLVTEVRQFAPPREKPSREEKISMISYTISLSVDSSSRPLRNAGIQTGNAPTFRDATALGAG